jgi:hypothetical protein
MTADTFDVIIQWNNQNVPWWNETCAQVLEVFGLPGHRFTYHPHEDYMTFSFNNEKDATLCKILLSERL